MTIRNNGLFRQSLNGTGNISLLYIMLNLYTATLLPAANEVCEGYVFTCVCQSFCSQGCVCLSACWDTPQEETPEQTPPPSRHPPEADTPPGADTPQEQTPPRGRHLPGSRYPQEQAPSSAEHAGRYVGWVSGGLVWNVSLQYQT